MSQLQPIVADQTLDSLRGRRVVVTGGCGFIGSHIVDAVEAVASVRVVDNLSSGDRSRLPVGVEFMHADVRDLPSLERALEGTDIVIHTAALVSVPWSVEMPHEYHDVNATGTMNLLRAARKNKVRRVVYSASSSAYGDAPEMPKAEYMADVPRSPYAASKLVGELYVRSFASVYEIDGVSLRYFNIFGPRQATDSAYAGVIAAFAKRLYKGERPCIYGDGTASRDFTFVANVVRANLLAAAREKPFKGEVINVATGKTHTVAELARRMAVLMGRGDLEPEFKPERLGDVPHSLADLTKARRELGYEVAVSFDEGLAQTVEWYRQKFSA